VHDALRLVVNPDLERSGVARLGSLRSCRAHRAALSVSDIQAQRENAEGDGEIRSFETWTISIAGDVEEILKKEDSLLGHSNSKMPIRKSLYVLRSFITGVVVHLLLRAARAASAAVVAHRDGWAKIPMHALILFGVATMLGLAGCATNHARAVRPFIGQYRGESGDFILIQSERTLWWLPAGADGSEAHYIGLFRPGTNRGLGIASASPYLGTAMSFSADGRVITVRWGEWLKRQGHSTDFARVR
jgi:hypothetical protein